MSVGRMGIGGLVIKMEKGFVDGIQYLLAMLQHTLILHFEFNEIVNKSLEF